MKFPPFIVEWAEIEKHRVCRFARTLLAAADQAVRARDVELVKLRSRIRTLERLHAVTEDRDAEFGDVVTYDFDGRRNMGVWLHWEDAPQRVAVLEPGDRVVVLRARKRVAQFPMAPAEKSVSTGVA